MNLKLTILLSALILAPELFAIDFSKVRKLKIYQAQKHEGLPRNHQLATSLFSIKKEEFRAEMGKEIESRDGLVFFESAKKPSTASYVLMNQKRNRLFPMSSVLKLRNINQTVRQKLIKEGAQEQYYHPGLQLMYVRTQGDTLKSYDLYKSKELRPEFEALRTFHVPK